MLKAVAVSWYARGKDWSVERGIQIKAEHHGLGPEERRGMETVMAKDYKQQEKMACWRY